MNTPLYDDHHLNVLSSVYYDNIRQIERLTQTNNEIRNILRASLRGYNNNRNNRNNRNRRNNMSSLENPNNTNYRTSNPNYGNSYSTPTQSENIASNAPRYFVDASYNLRRNARPIRNSILYNTLLNAFLEPVPTYPGTLQIEIATRNMLYGDIVSPRNTSCPISLERFENDDMVTTICYCGHIFMMAEIHHWFSNNCRCPVCRYDIREYRATPATRDPSANHLLSTDFSGNLFNTLTDAILNELLNSATDPSTNVVDANVATFYFTFPTREPE